MHTRERLTQSTGYEILLKISKVTLDGSSEDNLDWYNLNVKRIFYIKYFWKKENGII